MTGRPAPGRPEQGPAHDRAHGTTDRAGGGARSTASRAHPDGGRLRGPWRTGADRQAGRTARATPPDRSVVVAGRTGTCDRDPDGRLTGTPVPLPAPRARRPSSPRVPGPSPCRVRQAARANRTPKRAHAARCLRPERSARPCVRAGPRPPGRRRPGTHVRLLDPDTSPGTGTTATTFTFAVTYKSQNDSRGRLRQGQDRSTTHTMRRDRGARLEEGRHVTAGPASPGRHAGVTFLARRRTSSRQPRAGTVTRREGPADPRTDPEGHAQADPDADTPSPTPTPTATPTPKPQPTPAPVLTGVTPTPTGTLPPPIPTDASRPTPDRRPVRERRSEHASRHAVADR